ncbi:hypothetical protein NYF37_004624 [Salmonella enterica]|nr:hypothetical protein [Salmonella enterica]
MPAVSAMAQPMQFDDNPDIGRGQALPTPSPGSRMSVLQGKPLLVKGAFQAPGSTQNALSGRLPFVAPGTTKVILGFASQVGLRQTLTTLRGGHAPQKIQAVFVSVAPDLT